MLDGIPLRDPVFNTSNLDLVPADLVQRISMTHFSPWHDLTDRKLALLSRKNLREVPYSQLRYLSSSLGASKLGLDFSRSLARNAGFCVSVNQLRNLGFRRLGNSNHSSFFGSFYGRILSPFNLDLMSISNTRGLPEDNAQMENLYGGSLTTSNARLRLSTFFLRRQYEVLRLNNDTLDHDLNSLGFNGESGFDFEILKIRFGTSGQYHDLTSNYLPSDDWFESCLWTGFDLNLGRFLLRPVVGLSSYDFRNHFLLPRSICVITSLIHYFSL